METSMRIVNPLFLNHHRITTTATATAVALSSKLHLRTDRHRIFPSRLRTKSLSASYRGVFPSSSSSFPKLGLGFFLSLSSSNLNSNQNPQSPPNHTPNSHSSDAGFFTWHRPSPSSAPSAPSAAKKPKVAAVVLGWLGATQKHLRRYAEMYTSRGMETVTFVVPVNDAMRPDLGKTVEDRIEILAKEIVWWLSNDACRDKRLIFHTFSTTGWLVYGSILTHMQGRPDLIEKIKGCIVDSGGDPDLNPKVWASGFGAALLKKRNTRVSSSAETKPAAAGNANNKSKLQEEDHDILEDVFLAFLEIMFTIIFKYTCVNQKLSKIISHLTENQPECPQLYLYSTGDKVIPYRSVESFIEQQKLRGKKVMSFNFGSSPHVDHYRTFPDLYTTYVNNFVSDVLGAGIPT